MTTVILHLVNQSYATKKKQVLQRDIVHNIVVRCVRNTVISSRRVIQYLASNTWGRGRKKKNYSLTIRTDSVSDNLHLNFFLGVRWIDVECQSTTLKLLKTEKYLRFTEIWFRPIHTHCSGIEISRKNCLRYSELMRGGCITFTVESALPATYTRDTAI